MDGPYIRVEDSGLMLPLREDVTTIGRGRSVDVHLADPSVSRLHAEIIRRGPYAYVTDLGLSRNGTRVNGRLVARRVLEEGDVLTFGSARCRVFGIAAEELTAEVELRRPVAPELTRRELDVVTSLCRPALSDEAFVAPATAREIAADLVVTEAAVKQHLLRLYQKFRIPEGANRRVRLANEVVALGLVRPLPPTEGSGLAARVDGAGRAEGSQRASEPGQASQPAASHAPATPAPSVPAQTAPAPSLPAAPAPAAPALAGSPAAPALAGSPAAPALAGSAPAAPALAGSVSAAPAPNGLAPAASAPAGSPAAPAPTGSAPASSVPAPASPPSPPTAVAAASLGRPTGRPV
jgi:FHA domain